MSAQLPLVVARDGPPSSDPEVEQLLALVAEAVGSRWLLLELELEGSGRCWTYHWGEADGHERAEVALASPGLFSAWLHFEPAARAAAQLMQPLLSSALEQLLTMRWLRQQASVMRCAVDSTRRAVLLFDGFGNIVYANPAGDELLSRQTETGLQVALTTGARRPLITTLCDRVEHLDRSRRSTLEQLVLEDGSRLMCEMLSLEVVDGDHGPSIMFVIEPVRTDDIENEVAQVGRRFRLTEREQEVLARLCRGGTAQEVADDLCISPHTVRDHVKRLYRKTAARSRAELLQLVERQRFEAQGTYTGRVESQE